MISLHDIAIRQGDFQLRGVTLGVLWGRYGVLMGRTGAGKTTLLEAICGLRPIIAGRVQIGDRDVTGERPGSRGIGYVPQDGALFDGTVRQNLSFALRVRRWSAHQIAQRVEEVSRTLGIGALLERSVAGLSGGEAQRVALGRALAFEPAVLLLDEPLSALDDSTRADMHALLESIRASRKVTVLHVTHNAVDAERLADLVLELKDGRVIER